MRRTSGQTQSRPSPVSAHGPIVARRVVSAARASKVCLTARLGRVPFRRFSFGGNGCHECVLEDAHSLDAAVVNTQAGFS